MPLVHVAILDKSKKLLPKILSGEKTVESRWYKTRRDPWDRIKPGETVYFRNGGEGVAARAEVSWAKQFEFKDKREMREVIRKYAKGIGLGESALKKWKPDARYCVLVGLRGAVEIKRPFHVDKAGFGNACAWMTMEAKEFEARR